MLLLLLVTTATFGSVLVNFFNNTALAGPSQSHAQATHFGFEGPPVLPASVNPSAFSASWQGMLSATPGTSAIFSVETDAGYVRLWVDDHLLVDSSVTGGTSHDPVPEGAYTKWPHTNIDDGKGRGMKDVGGDCIDCGSTAKCIDKCEKLKDKGCVGFVAAQGNGTSVTDCYMRKLDSQDKGMCEGAMQVGAKADTYMTWTADDRCSFDPSWRPGGKSDNVACAST